MRYDGCFGPTTPAKGLVGRRPADAGVRPVGAGELHVTELLQIVGRPGPIEPRGIEGAVVERDWCAPRSSPMSYLHPDGTSLPGCIRDLPSSVAGVWWQARNCRYLSIRSTLIKVRPEGQPNGCRRPEVAVIAGTVQDRAQAVRPSGQVHQCGSEGFGIEFIVRRGNLGRRENAFRRATRVSKQQVRAFVTDNRQLLPVRGVRWVEDDVCPVRGNASA